MKKRLLSLALSVLPFIAVSQVSLNSSMAPPVNSLFIYYDANVPVPTFVYGTSGTTNIWDFSMLAPVPGADDTTFVVSPSSVPGAAAAFPSATHGTYEGGEDGITMMEINSSGVTFLGSMADLTGSGNPMPLVVVPPLQAMAFPYVYGSNANAAGYFELLVDGATAGQPSMDSVRFKSSVSGQRNVIASGDIILPSGTFDAILERSIDTHIDSLWVKGPLTLGQWILAPGFPQGETDSAFYWYTNQSLLPMAHALYDNTGLHDVNYFKSMVTGLNETQPIAAGNIYPNPVSDVLHIRLPSNAQENQDLKVLNVQGQLVLRGYGKIDQLNVSYLQAGMYFIQLTDADGKISTVKFVKN